MITTTWKVGDKVRVWHSTDITGSKGEIIQVPGGADWTFMATDYVVVRTDRGEFLTPMAWISLLPAGVAQWCR